MNAIDKISDFLIEFPGEEIKTWEVMRFIYLPRLIFSALLDRPRLKPCDPHGGRFVIVGAGPTLVSEFDNLKLTCETSTLCSLNGSHGWLIKKGLIPNIHPILEGDLEDIEQCLDGTPHKDVTYYLCSTINENVFKQLTDYNVVIWHAYAQTEEYKGALNLLFPNEPVIGGGLFTLFRLIMIGSILGYNNFDLFGIDSSFEGNSDHVEGYSLTDKEPAISMEVLDTVTNETRLFKTNTQLIAQAQVFIKFCDMYPDFKIKVHGDSLLRVIHRMKRPDLYVR